jgi:hypothetical protein
MSIFEFSCDEDTGSGDHVSFGADSFGYVATDTPDVQGMPAGMNPTQKRLWYARYYREVILGQRPPPPAPPKARSNSSVSVAAPRGGMTSGSGGGPAAPNLSQIAGMAKQIPSAVNAAKSGFSALSSLASGLSNGDVDPNVSADVSINGEFFDDELTWPGHRHYTHLYPFKTGPLGAQDPFTNADFGAEDGMGFDETFMCASNQLPAMIFGADPPPKISWWKSIIMDFSGAGQDASPTNQVTHPLYLATHGGGL